MTRVLVVCMGNICRSPMAHSVLCAIAQERGLGARVEVDSAGTHAGTAGLPTDPRALASLARGGYDTPPGGHPAARRRARRVVAADFERHDLLLAMDADNLAALHAHCPPPLRYKLRLWLDFAPGHAGHEVPDPYYGDAPGFDHVLALCEAGARGVMDFIEDRSGVAL
jgi:protein-tyrosine phosphatase